LGSIHSRASRARLFRLAGPAILGAAVALSSAPPAPTAAATSAAAAVTSVARAQVGDPYRYGAMGPSSFDCSGLVLYSFKQAGYYSVVGSGRYRSALSLYTWFKNRGLASRSNGRPGDIVIWGGGKHAGIYLGGGMAVSALVRGVRVHSIYAVTLPFTAFLHTHLSTTSTSTTSSTSSTTSVSTSTTYRSTITRVNLRRGPSTAYARITVLATGTRMAVLSRARDSLGRLWYKVSTAGRLGWVAAWLTH
jgi:cell wall-associated NlpC family hydrolase